MGTRALEHFFDPKSIAVIGASDRLGSMGGAVVKNLLQSGFGGPVYPVNLKRYKTVKGLKCYTKLSRLPAPVDLVVICTPESAVDTTLKQCERLGVKAAMILTGGFSRNTSHFSYESRQKSKGIRGVRVLGPDCYGIMVPHRNLNISYSHIEPVKGNIAYIGQSGSLASSMLDWATERGIGFRYFLTLGEGIDIKLADLIDYLAQDHSLGAILLQLEHIPDAAKLARAIRVCSRRQLVVYVKTKHGVELGLPPETPPAGLQYRDDVHGCALRRAGSLRVDRIESLFEAAEVLGHGLKIHDLPLVILSNGIGPARVALDHLLHRKGRNYWMSAEDRVAIKKLIKREPGQFNHVIDLGFDAIPDDYAKVIRHIQKHMTGHPILILHSPSGAVEAVEVARSILKAHQKRSALLACWLGGNSVNPARALFEQRNIPCLTTPERAIDVYLMLVNHRHSRQVLSETPEPSKVAEEKHQEVEEMMQQALASGRDYLTAKEAFECLRRIRLPLLNTAFADDLDSLERLKLDKLDKQPVALKIIHAQYCQPFAYGENPRDRWRGVALPIRSRVALVEAAKRLIDELQKRHPKSNLHGFSVQPIRKFQDGLQLSMGITQDPEYGPLIFFGGGGSAANIIADRRMDLPPLNTTLAKALVKSTHVYKVLKERCSDHKLARNNIVELLLKLSRLAESSSRINSCELNVFLDNDLQKLQIMGFAIGLHQNGVGLCFPPPPLNLSISAKTTAGLKLTIRPITAEDEPKLMNFHNQLSDETLKNRFFVLRRNLSHDDFARLTQIDYVREMAFIALNKDGYIVGVVRCFIDPDFIQAEYSIVVRDDFQKMGVGSILLNKLVSYLKNKGVVALIGETLTTNQAMIALAKKQGFVCEFSRKSNLLLTRIMLNNTREEWHSMRLKKWYSNDEAK